MILLAVIPSLLVSLCSQQVAVRRGALKCLQVVRQHGRHDDNIFASVIKRLISQEEEILADHRHMMQVRSSLVTFVSSYHVIDT